MARRQREEHRGAIHHVYARRVEGRALFGDDEDRRAWLRLLAFVVGWKSWRCLAYCLMDTHYHLLVETRRANLGAGMQYLNGRYARAYNDRSSRTGHVFDGRYGSILVRDDPQLLAAVRYIARNPVEAGMVERPEAYRWSSHATVVNGVAVEWLDVARLLEFFGGPGRAARERYTALVDG